MEKILIYALILIAGLAMGLGTLIEDGEKYKISNPEGALTVDGMSRGSNVSVHAYNGSAEQQWKFEKAHGENIYLMRPVTEEYLVLDVEETESGFFARLFSFGNSQRHWEIIDLGGDHVEFKNKRYDLCIKNFGLDMPVDISDCGNSTDTSWNITKIK